MGHSWLHHSTVTYRVELVGGNFLTFEFPLHKRGS